jgi:hypothetical protein
MISFSVLEVFGKRTDLSVPNIGRIREAFRPRSLGPGGLKPDLSSAFPLQA